MAQLEGGGYHVMSGSPAFQVPRPLWYARSPGVFGSNCLLWPLSHHICSTWVPLCQYHHMSFLKKKFTSHGSLLIAVYVQNHHRRNSFSTSYTFFMVTQQSISLTLEYILYFMSFYQVKTIKVIQCKIIMHSLNIHPLF
jgi:hypothetical protein